MKYKTRENYVYLTGLCTGLAFWNSFFIIPAIILLILCGTDKDANCVSSEVELKSNEKEVKKYENE